MELQPDEVFRIEHAVQRRLLDYWHDVDRNRARTARSFYTADSIYEMVDLRMEGPDAVQRYYDYRESRGERLVRHVVSNLRVEVLARDRARLDGVLCVYAADGVPVLPSAPPIMVADTECEFVRPDGRPWQFRLHRLIALFKGGVPVLVPPAS